MNRTAFFLLAGLTTMSVLTSTAEAETYSFSCLSNTSATNCADGAATLMMDVTNPGGGRVDFTFRNYSRLGSIISEVYFDDGTLLGISTLLDSGANVNFTTLGVSPPNLPAGNNATPPFRTTAGFSADVVKNPKKSGVKNATEVPNVQDFLTVRFDLINGKSFNDTLNALNGGIAHTAGNLSYPALRVGLHVVSFANGGSESFMNSAAPIPEADTYALMLAGLGVVGFVARRRRAGEVQ